MADDQPVIRCWHCVNAADIKDMHDNEDGVVPTSVYRRAMTHLNFAHLPMGARRVR